MRINVEGDGSGGSSGVGLAQIPFPHPEIGNSGGKNAPLGVARVL